MKGKILGTTVWAGKSQRPLHIHVKRITMAWLVLRLAKMLITRLLMPFISYIAAKAFTVIYIELSGSGVCFSVSYCQNKTMNEINGVSFHCSQNNIISVIVG